MTCSLCQRIADSSESFVGNECVQSAIEIITKHFQLLQNSVDEKENTVKALQLRNDKLLRAIELLQRKQQQDALISIDYEQSPPKRRKASVPNCETDFDKLSAASDSSFADGFSSRLNTALNSEDFDVSCSSPSRTEAVAETEKIRSPRVFRTPTEFNKRVRRLKLTGLKTEQKSLSINSKKQTELLVKDEVASNKVENIKPDLPAKTTPTKLKQTTLHFEVPKKKTVSVAKDFSDDVATTSKAANPPNFLVPNKKTATLCYTANHQLDINKDENKVKVDTRTNSEGNIFNASIAKGSTNTELRLDLSTKNDDVLAEDELFPSPLPKSKIAPSCILLSPPTPEIVFLDDTMDENSNKSVDLSQSSTKSNDDSWLIPKAAEKPDMSAKALETSKKLCANDRNNSLLPMPDDTVVNIKKEKHGESVSFNDFDSYSDDLIRQVESELLTENKPPPKKLSIKERFNIDCTHCQNYIDFLDGQLTDKQIEEHLRKCSRHKERDVLRNLTPDDFWNPLLQSFAEDDPRNEVLIDKRIGTKKRYR